MTLRVITKTEKYITWYILQKRVLFWYEELVRSNDKRLMEFPKKYENREETPMPEVW